MTARANHPRQPRQARQPDPPWQHGPNLDKGGGTVDKPPIGAADMDTGEWAVARALSLSMYGIHHRGLQMSTLPPPVSEPRSDDAAGTINGNLLG